MLREYDVEIDYIHFENPLEIGAFFRNISKQTANWVLERTIFYKEEWKGDNANEISRQQLIDMKMKNAERAVVTRKKLLKGPGACRKNKQREFLGNLLFERGASVRLEQSDRR